MQQQKQYVGIDLHRRRSVIVRMTEDGEVLDTVRIVNDPVALSLELANAGPDPEVALEACYGWYWAADLLESDGARVHLVHPLGLPTDCGETTCPRAGSLRPSCASYESSSATGAAWWRFAPRPRPRCTR